MFCAAVSFHCSFLLRMCIMWKMEAYRNIGISLEIQYQGRGLWLSLSLFCRCLFLLCIVKFLLSRVSPVVLNLSEYFGINWSWKKMQSYTLCLAVETKPVYGTQRLFALFTTISPNINFSNSYCHIYGVTICGVWTGEWISSSLIHITQNYQ